MPDTTILENDTPEALAQNLYKQNSELAVKNKTLSLLSKLYEISVLTLESKELTTRVSKELQTNLSFELVGILLFDQAAKEFTPIAFSSSERIRDVQLKYNTFFEKMIIPSSRSPFLQRVIDQKSMVYTNEPKDIWDSLIPESMFEEIRTSGHIKSSLLYPLVSGDKVIGILLFSLNRLYTDLVDYEKQSIESFINVIAVALDKALLDEQLKLTNKQLENLLHFISHEVKGALSKTRIILNEIIDRPEDQVPLEVKKMATIADSDNKKSVEMVMNVLGSADFKSGKISTVKAPFDFKASLLEEVSELAVDAQAKGLTMNTTVEDKDASGAVANYTIVGDHEKLTQNVIRNLIDNSIRYTLSGGIKIHLERNGSKILLSIKDTGVGISDSDKKRLFTEGGHGEHSTEINVHSTGYGLFFAKSIVENHGGRVWAESAGEGKGSTFYVELPAA